MEIIKLCVEQAEMEALMRAEEAKKKLEEEEATKTAGWFTDCVNFCTICYVIVTSIFENLEDQSTDEVI